MWRPRAKAPLPHELQMVSSRREAPEDGIEPGNRADRQQEKRLSPL